MMCTTSCCGINSKREVIQLTKGPCEDARAFLLLIDVVSDRAFELFDKALGLLHSAAVAG